MASTLEHCASNPAKGHNDWQLLNYRCQAFHRKRRTNPLIYSYFEQHKEHNMKHDKSTQELCASNKDTFSCFFLIQGSTVIGYSNVPSYRFKHLLRRESPSADCVATKLGSCSPLDMTNTMTCASSWHKQETHILSAEKLWKVKELRNFSGLNLHTTCPEKIKWACCAGYLV